ncbi:hypothetical protein FRB91_003978 [Serendipita sp. 411]|nr:hypothetical protein FRB91_003978 [Serendipita sp. 411]
MLSDSSRRDLRLNDPHFAWRHIKPAPGFSMAPPSNLFRRPPNGGAYGRLAVAFPQAGQQQKKYALVALRGTRVPPYTGRRPLIFKDYYHPLFFDGSLGPSDPRLYVQEYDCEEPWFCFYTIHNDIDPSTRPIEVWNPPEFFDASSVDPIDNSGGFWKKDLIRALLNRRRQAEEFFWEGGLRKNAENIQPLLDQYGKSLPFFDDLDLNDVEHWRDFADGSGPILHCLSYTAGLLAVSRWLIEVYRQARSSSNTHVDPPYSQVDEKYMGAWVGSIDSLDDWRFILRSTVPLYAIFEVPNNHILARTPPSASETRSLDGDEFYRMDAYTAGLPFDWVPKSSYLHHPRHVGRIYYKPHPMGFRGDVQLPHSYNRLNPPAGEFDISHRNRTEFHLPWNTYLYRNQHICRLTMNPSPSSIEVAAKWQSLIASMEANHPGVDEILHPALQLIPQRDPTSREPRVFLERHKSVFFWIVALDPNEAERFRANWHGFCHELGGDDILLSEWPWPIIGETVPLFSPNRIFSRKGQELLNKPKYRRVYVPAEPGDENIPRRHRHSQSTLPINRNRQALSGPLVNGKRRTTWARDEDVGLHGLTNHLCPAVSGFDIWELGRNLRSRRPDSTASTSSSGRRSVESSVVSETRRIWSPYTTSTPSSSSYQSHCLSHYRHGSGDTHSSFSPSTSATRNRENLRDRCITSTLSFPTYPTPVLPRAPSNNDGPVLPRPPTNNDDPTQPIPISSESFFGITPDVDLDQMFTEGTAQDTMAQDTSLNEWVEAFVNDCNMMEMANIPLSSAFDQSAYVLECRARADAYQAFCLHSPIAPPWHRSNRIHAVRYINASHNISIVGYPIRVQNVYLGNTPASELATTFLRAIDANEFGDIILISAFPEADGLTTVDVVFRYPEDALHLWTCDGFAWSGHFWKVSPLKRLSGHIMIVPPPPIERTMEVRIARLCGTLQAELQLIDLNMRMCVKQMEQLLDILESKGSTPLASPLASPPASPPASPTAQDPSDDTHVNPVQIDPDSTGIWSLGEDDGKLGVSMRGWAVPSAPVVPPVTNRRVDDHIEMSASTRNQLYRGAYKLAERKYLSWLNLDEGISLLPPPPPPSQTNSADTSQSPNRFATSPGLMARNYVGYIQLWCWYEDCTRRICAAFQKANESPRSSFQHLNQLPNPSTFEQRRDAVVAMSFMALLSAFSPRNRLNGLYGKDYTLLWRLLATSGNA